MAEQPDDQRREHRDQDQEDHDDTPGDRDLVALEPGPCDPAERPALDSARLRRGDDLLGDERRGVAGNRLRSNDHERPRPSPAAARHAVADRCSAAAASLARAPWSPATDRLSLFRGLLRPPAGSATGRYARRAVSQSPLGALSLRCQGWGRQGYDGPVINFRPPCDKGVTCNIGTRHTARRPSNARPSVISSAYSRSPPTGRPLASRVTAMPMGFTMRAR